MTAIQTTDPAPDWNALAVEMHCPLCEYNLRGLDQPRCPECGFTFTWAELKLGQEQTHPYLFEHHPKRNIWSFWKTYWRDCLPQTFWQELSPAQPVRMLRLMMYWCIAIWPVAVAFILPFSVVVWDNFQSARSGYATPGSISAVAVPGSIPPPPSVLDCLQSAVEAATVQQFSNSPFAAVIIVLAWPWLTLLLLMVFAESMRKAKIKKRHVLRVIIYGTDFGLAMLMPLVIANGQRFEDGYPLLIALLCGAVTLYRVSIAYNRYLRFHMPFATVLSSQIIVMMIFLIAYLRVVQH